MKNKNILRFYRFKDKTPEEDKLILFIGKTEEDLNIIKYKDLNFYSDFDLWIYAEDLIKTVYFEAKINDILFSLADDQSIDLQFNSKELDTSLRDFLNKRIQECSFKLGDNFI